MTFFFSVPEDPCFCHAVFIRQTVEQKEGKKGQKAKQERLSKSDAMSMQPFKEGV